MAQPDPGSPTPAGLDVTPVGPPVTERPAASRPGLQMLPLGIVILIIGAVLVALVSHLSGAAAATLLVVGVLVLLSGALVLRGLTAVVPGQARILVRAQTSDPVDVSLLPIYSSTAVRNAPPRFCVDRRRRLR